MIFSSPSTSHVEALQQHNARYDADLAAGKFEPFVYPWGSFGAGVVLLYLLIDHRQRPWLRKARYLAWLFVSGFAVHSIIYMRARNPAAAFGVGLINAWSILWCGTILVWNDAQTDFRRIERLEGSMGQSRREEKVEGNGIVKSNGEIASSAQHGTVGPSKRTGTLAWQDYPVSPFIERLDWVADVFCNFRGMGWNWRISGLPPPPKSVQEELHDTGSQDSTPLDIHVGRDGTRRYPTKPALFRAKLPEFLYGSLLLDLVKVLMSHDPYFWGVSNPPPPSYLPLTIQHSPALLRITRLTLSLLGIHWALRICFTLAPLFFCGLLGSPLIGVRGSPWMYPDSYGSYANVLNKGLAGWWGGWWHQMFRFAFEAPSKQLIRSLGLHPKTLSAKVLQLVVAFTLSGFVHACGSATFVAETRPLAGSFAFFALQILGIGVQMLGSMLLEQAGVTERTPKLVRQVLNFGYVHVWFYYTAPLLCDDFARGGLWLFEPLPVSPVRMMGFGVKGEGWWRWVDLVRWHGGDRWWKSGIAL